MPTEISTTDLKTLIDSKQKYILLDIREKSELVHGVIPTSVNVPFSELEGAEKMAPTEFEKKYGFQKFSKTDTVIVYCRAGRRSTLASKLLSDKGYKVKNYAGSVLAWSKIDKTVKAY
jgi:thiosulfate:glutathione sulfurtransferase